MAGPRILLVIGGGIAAYKSCELVRLIRKGGGDVTCVLTEGGAQFVTPMSLAALSGNPVYTSLWDLKNETEIGHIELSRSADLVVVCPATANLMAKMAAGIADDLATTLLLATNKPVICVPAMNVKMWEHDATQRNIDSLRQGGVHIVQPDLGPMACGEFGPGRLPEPEMVWLEIAESIGLDPGEAGAQEIHGYLEALEPEEEEGEDAGDSDGGQPGSLGGLLSGIIARSMPPRIESDDIVYGEDGEYLAPLPEEVPLPGSGEDMEEEEEAYYEGPDLPELDDEDYDAGPLLATKGGAKAAPPTDREALNHEVNARQSVPEPFEGEEAAAPVGTMDRLIEKAPRGEVMQAPVQGEDGFAGAFPDMPLEGRHVLVTAGPTHEAIDPVRYLANRSSGRQGYAIAAAAAAAGARVTLVSGPVHLPTPAGVDRVDVESAQDMAAAVKKALPADAAIMVAAVSDWRTREYHEDKIKKRGSAPPALVLTENPDILAGVAASPKRPGLLIGFAAETENVVENAKKKRKSKGVDWIVANDVSGDVMGGDENEVRLVREGGVETWDRMSKQDVARLLIERMAEKLAHVE